MESAGATFYKIGGCGASATLRNQGCLSKASSFNNTQTKVVIKNHFSSFKKLGLSLEILVFAVNMIEQLASDIKSFEGIIAAEVPLDDFEYDDVDEVYSYACRCGIFTEIDMKIC